MPIDFPPPPTPIQGELVSLQADANQGSVTATVAGYTLYVHAPGVFDQVDVSAITAGIEDVSTAVRALAAAAQRKGVLAPKTLYVQSGNDIYVSVYAGSINALDAPAPLRPYFENLGQGGPVSIEEFERRRLFASIHANRMGAGFTPVFTPATGDGFDLTLKPGTEPVNPGSVRVNLSNAGNRFTGREFLDLDARRGTDSGDEFSALARTAASVLEIDDVEPGSDYHEYQLGWSRVTPIGLFGATARYIDYRQQAVGMTFNGEIWTVDIGYTGVVQSSATSRITVQTRIDYLSKRLELDSDGTAVQKEPYPSLELGAAWTTSFSALSTSWLSTAAVSARQGFGNESAALTRADLDYWLVRPSYALRSQGNLFTAELQLATQYADVTVPEQQQWIVGGIGNLHAYVPGVAVGDRGLLVRLTGEYKGFSYYDVSFKPRAFVEFAAAQYDQDFGGQLPDGVQSLTDIGAEVVIGIRPWLETALTAALPVQHDNISKQVRDDARADFFFRLTAKF
ncbi:MAG: ShlB/FhaC/HecB family hemolysin secretion/activation protein [Pseudomonadota bacterium]